MRGRRRTSRRALLLAACVVVAACDSSLLELPRGAGSSAAQASTVVFLSSSPRPALPPEEAAALAWLESRPEFVTRHTTFVDLARARLPRGAVLWWHYAAEEALPSVSVRRQSLRAVQNHLRGGGNLLLSGIAASYVVPLEIESSPPDLVSRRARLSAPDDEVVGYQSRGHPVLTRFWGSALPSSNTGYRHAAAAIYSGDRWPTEGRVWAMHRSGDAVDARLKIGLEYPDVYGAGATVVTLGAHINFADAANRNRAELEQLVADVLRYLDRQAPAAPPGAGLGPSDQVEAAIAARAERRYWEPVPSTFVGFEPAPGTLPPAADATAALNLVERSRSGLQISRYDDGGPFTLTSRRALLRGAQSGRIEEFRVHPQLLASQLRIGIVRPGRGVVWLDAGAGSREFIARPEGDELHYNDGEIQLRLHMTVDRRHPALVALLQLESPAALDIIAAWQAHGGAQVPSGEGPFAAPRIGWDEGAQAFVWDSGDGFVAKGGFGRATARHILGFDAARDLQDNGLVLATETARDDSTEPAATGEQPPAPTPAPRDLSRVAIQVRVEPGRPALLPLVLVGGPRAEVDVDSAFAELVAAPGRPWVENADYFAFLNDRTLGLLAPYTVLEDAFKWAKVGIDSLRVELPDVGMGIAAGYGAGGATARWIAPLGTVGGNDALWAAMAADAYGDRELAAAVLRMAARYQGVDGRIADRVGAAGAPVHLSAAPTALYLVALDNHLRTWGDLELLAELWPSARAGLDYLFAADRGGDGLIDAVSRRDRWSEDPAVQTPIDLAALWGAALRAGEQLASLSGEPQLSARARGALEALRPVLNDPFWNPGERRFNFARRVDGSFVPVSTALPAVPMIFDLLDAGTASATLDAFSSSAFTRDWGVTLIGTLPDAGTPSSEAVAPTPSALPVTGLPAPGADVVTPVFTGWTALAEYANHRPEAGFAHAATNLLLLQHGNPGYAGGAFDGSGFSPRPGVAVGAAAQALTVLPVVWGMLGIRPDALNRSISITPQLPAGLDTGLERVPWPRANVDQVRVGDSEFRLLIRRSLTQILFQVDRWRGPRDITLRITAHVPAEVAIAAQESPPGFRVIDRQLTEETGRRAATVTVQPSDDAVTSVVSFTHDAFPQVLPPPQLTAGPAEAPGGLRLIRSRYQGGVLRIQAEGLPGQTYPLRVATPWNVSQVTGAPGGVRIIPPSDGIATISVTIPGSGNRYRPIDLQVTFER